MNSPFVILQERIRPHGGLTVRILISLSLFLLLPIVMYGLDDPCEGADREPVKLASSLPKLSSDDLSKVTFGLKEAEGHFGISLRVAGKIVAERLFRKPNPVEEVLYLQVITVKGNAALFINYAAGAAGRMQCASVVFAGRATNRFHSMLLPGMNFGIEDIDSDGETDIISYEYQEDANCFSMAEMPYWHRIYHVNPLTQKVEDVSREFARHYKSLAQEYRRLLDQLDRNPDSPAACKQGMRNLIRQADELTGKGTSSSSSVIGQAPRGEGKYSIKLFNCDDGCRAYLNERLVGETGFGQDSGWIDISNRLGSGAAKLNVEVINRTGAIAYGLQVRGNGSAVLSEVCGKAGVIGCDNNAQAPAGVAREFSYTILPGADSTSDSVLFEVSKSDDGTFRIFPIVELRRGILFAPDPSSESPRGVLFAKEYYRPGNRYKLLFGGADAGALTMIRTEDFACGFLRGVVQPQTTTKIGGRVAALATNSESVGRRASSRRAPSASERTAVLNLAQSIYRQKGVPAALIRNMETINLTATDLEGDETFELIGSFVIKLENSEQEYELFFLAEPTTVGYEPKLVSYYKAEDMYHKQVFYVDQVDLDGDGVSEVVTSEGYGEGIEFGIYKRQGGRWVKIYQGSGYGC